MRRLVAMLSIVLGACLQPSQATPDVSWFQRESPPPSCITDYMENTYGSCGRHRVRRAAPGRCAPRERPATTLEPGSADGEDPACVQRTDRIRALDREGESSAALHELNQLLTAYDAGTAVECGSQLVELLLDLADDALATDNDIDLAEQLYRRVIATFDQQELDAWGVCASLDELRHSRAELLLRQQKWSACAVAFDEALAGSSSSQEQARDAALASVVCHHRAWETWRAEQARSPLLGRIEGQLEDSARWKGLLGSYRRFLCLGGAGRLRNDVALARAEAFSQGGALWEAAVGFRLLAFEATGSPEGVVAAARYAEVMSNLAVDDGCRFQLGRDLERLHLLNCSRPVRGCDALGAAAVRAGAVVVR